MDTNSTEDIGTGAIKVVRPGVAFGDDRGVIRNLLDEPCGGVQYIVSARRTWRSSHYHKKDSHWLYVLSGFMEYYERPVGSTDRPRHETVRSGEMVWSGPMMEHWTYFPIETDMVCMSAQARTHDAHEADLVRVPPLKAHEAHE